MPDETVVSQERDMADNAQRKVRIEYIAVSKEYIAASKRLDSLTMELLVTKKELVKLEARKSELLKQVDSGDELPANGNGKGKNK